MMHVREILIEALRLVVDDLAAGKTPDWSTALARLDDARTAALAEVTRDPGLVVSVVSAANLLADCARRGIDPTAAQEAVRRLDVSVGWETGFPPPELLRQGPTVKLPPGETPMGFSAIQWEKFLKYYGEHYGRTRDKRSREQLWNDLVAGTIRVPLRDVDLADSKGASSSWVTDDGEDGATLKTNNATRDVYDALGLNWQSREETTRAVLLCCPLHVRQARAQSLHCPTSLDGWGQPFFVPRPSRQLEWPDHGSRTARPTSDDPVLPEAIHGRAEASPESVSVVPLPSEVRVGNRILDYGAQAVDRAIGRLRKAVGA